MKGASEDQLVEHSTAVAREMPLVGFYLQPAVGGIALGRRFWARFAAIENVIAIKVAPFDRYATLDVVRGVVAAEAEERVALYTGNDDHIVFDLLAPFMAERAGQRIVVRFAVGARALVGLGSHRGQILSVAARPGPGRPEDLLALDSRVTDCNSAFFDPANGLGCIAGCHEILRRQGLFEGIWCLDLTKGSAPVRLPSLSASAGSTAIFPMMRS
jgi:hypothetical protein